MVNGREFEWASLFARLDRFITLQEQATVETLVHNRTMQQSVERLPERIANAISAHRHHAAPAAPASRLSGWTELVTVLWRLVMAIAAVSLVYLPAADRGVTFPQILRLLAESLS